MDRRGFGIKQDFIPLFFFIYVQILWQGQKAVLTIVEFYFLGIFSSKFQLVSTFSICSKFCVENWLLCCDLSCKWVTCKSGCKRFWKSALHILMLRKNNKQVLGLYEAKRFSLVFQSTWVNMQHSPGIWMTRTTLNCTCDKTKCDA